MGWYLEPHDLAVSKLAAGREKDIAFVEAMVRKKFISPALVQQRLAETQWLQPGLAELLRARLKAATATT